MVCKAVLSGLHFMVNSGIRLSQVINPFFEKPGLDSGRGLDSQLFNA